MGNVLTDLFIPHLYVFWGLSHHEPTGAVWRASSGMDVFADARYGLPFLRGRAMLIYLGNRMFDEKYRTGNNTFRGSLDDINDFFETDWPIDRLKDQFLRVAHASYGCSKRRCVCAPARCYGQHPVANRVQFNKNDNTFLIELSRDFYRKATTGMRCKRDHVLRFIHTDQLAALDLYAYYHWWPRRLRCQSVDTFGPMGPFQYIKSSRDKYNRRVQLRRLQQRVVEVWPECPYHISAKCEQITCEPERKQRIRRVYGPARGRGRPAKRKTARAKRVQAATSAAAVTRPSCVAATRSSEPETASRAPSSSSTPGPLSTPRARRSSRPAHMRTLKYRPVPREQRTQSNRPQSERPPTTRSATMEERERDTRARIQATEQRVMEHMNAVVKRVLQEPLPMEPDPQE